MIQIAIGILFLAQTPYKWIGILFIIRGALRMIKNILELIMNK